MSAVPPLRREIVVAADASTAFRVFTESIGSWWPLERFSVHGGGSDVSFHDGLIVERAAGLPDAVWGRVQSWNPPTGLSFTWHPGASDARASLVVVSFERISDARTLVRLEHSGWDTLVDPAGSRAEYGRGWPVVLDALRRRVDSAESTWVVLLHSPLGAHGAEVFTDERFAGHVAFLEALKASGLLVAAGPLGDQPGAGMTIVRAPGRDSFDEVRRRAMEEDAAVASGLLTVSVRPWSPREVP